MSYAAFLGVEVIVQNLVALPLSALLFLAHPFGAHAQSKKPIVAVFTVEDREGRLKNRLIIRLSDYLAMALAATGQYRIVPRNELKKRLVGKKKSSYKNCYDQTCQIEIGKELAAQKSLSTVILKLGSKCMVTSVLFDLRTAASEGGASIEGDCDEDGIVNSTKMVVKKLVLARMGATDHSKAAPAMGLHRSPNTKRTRKRIKWTRIPAGHFRMGNNKGSQNEQPVHTVTISRFFIAQTETTVAQYEACVTAGACQPPTWSEPNSEFNLTTGSNNKYRGFTGKDQPITGISWHDAKAFCTWAKARLPSEAEWEYSARSAGVYHYFPWGNEKPNCVRAVMDGSLGDGCGSKHTAPPCTKPQGNSKQGLCDMSGNVSEMVEDCWFPSYIGAPASGVARTTGCNKSRIVYRGGNFATPLNLHKSLSATMRRSVSKTHQDRALGFRCARSLQQ